MTDSTRRGTWVRSRPGRGPPAGSARTRRSCRSPRRRCRSARSARTAPRRGGSARPTWEIRPDRPLDGSWRRGDSVALPPLTVIRTWTGPKRVETVGPETRGGSGCRPRAAVAAGVVPVPDDPLPPEVPVRREVPVPPEVPVAGGRPAVRHDAGRTAGGPPDRLVGGLEPNSSRTTNDRPDEHRRGTARDHDHRSVPIASTRTVRHGPAGAARRGSEARLSVARIIEAGPQT